MTPDTTVFVLAFSAYCGAERPFYQLAHDLVLRMPPLWWLPRSPHLGSRCGTI